MRAIAIVPGRPETAAVVEVPEPPLSDGSLLVRTRLIGICGTDGEIAVAGYGEPPPGERQLVVGHESLGEVLEAPAGSGFAPGDLVAGVVRRPDPVPCAACAADEWDMCLNGRFVERGIKGRHGYGSERFRLDPRFAVRLDPALGDLGVLLEPASVLAKAFEHADRIGARGWFEPKVALVTGAGPIGLLGAMIARQRGLETHVVDVVPDGPKPALVADLGATYHCTPVAELPIEPDLVVECTGIGHVVQDAAALAAPGGVVALTGLSDGSRFHVMTESLVLVNKAIFGSVNAARRHYDQAAAALARADPMWLSRLITRVVAPEDWPSALAKRPDDIKVVVDMLR